MPIDDFHKPQRASDKWRAANHEIVAVAAGEEISAFVTEKRVVTFVGEARNCLDGQEHARIRPARLEPFQHLR